MNISNTGLALIKVFEGCLLEAYQDSVGVWTIGHGHTLQVKHGDMITAAGAELLLLNDLKSVEHTLNSVVHTPLTQNQYDALCSFVFNLGTKAFSGSTLLKKINSEEYAAAADEIVKWNKAGGQPEAGLTRRRTAERQLFLTK